MIAAPKLGKIPRNDSRRFKSMGNRQGQLHPKKLHISANMWDFAAKNFYTTVDMFASPGNAQMKNFVSRWPHHKALGVNALEVSLERVSRAYANPPWTLIFHLLNRLRQNPHVTCLLVVPYLVGTAC